MVKRKATLLMARHLLKILPLSFQIDLFQKFSSKCICNQKNIQLCTLAEISWLQKQNIKGTVVSYMSQKLPKALHWYICLERKNDDSKQFL